MKEQIEKSISENLPIDVAFLQLCAANNYDNNTAKSLLKELIFAYTKNERKQLEQSNQALENARFAYQKAENELSETLSKLFNSLINSKINDVCKDCLEELALSDIGNLHFLEQTCESGFISILEEGVLVNERAHAFASYLLISACKQLQPARILHAAKLILKQSLEMANLWQSYASELVHGCIGGLYEALELICERAIKELKSGCSEPMAKELLELEENFANIIASLSGKDFAGSILREIYDNELSSISAKLARALGRGKHVLGLKLSEFSEDAKRSASLLQLDARVAANKLISKLRK